MSRPWRPGETTPRLLTPAWSDSLNGAQVTSGVPNPGTLTTAMITSFTAPAVTQAYYPGVCVTSVLSRSVSSLGFSQRTQVSNSSGNFQGQTDRGVSQRPSEIPLDQALLRVFPQGISAAVEQFIAPQTEPDTFSLRKQMGRSPLDSIMPLQRLRQDVMDRYPDHQVDPLEPAPTKPTSLGLANFQQAEPARAANLPRSPSLESWLLHQQTILEGKDRLGKPIREPYGPRAYPKLPSLRAHRFEPSNAPSLLRTGQLPTEWHRCRTRAGSAQRP